MPLTYRTIQTFLLLSENLFITWLLKQLCLNKTVQGSQFYLESYDNSVIHNREKGYHSLYSSSIVSQPSKCLKFMTFREGCLSYAVECKYLSEALKTFYQH